MKISERFYAAERPNRVILGRTLCLMMVCGILTFALLTGQLWEVQIVGHEHYEELALRQQGRSIKVTAKRGTIYDRNGTPLAVSATAYSVYISPYEIKYYGEDVASIAAFLSKTLGVSEESVLKKAQDSSSWYKTVAVRIETDKAAEIRRFKEETGIRGIHVESDMKRYYPEGDLACHVIGFVGADGNGLEGVEAVYDEYLTGTDGYVRRLKAADGTDMLTNRLEEYDAGLPGCDVELTIDANIQYICEKYLDQAIEDYKAEGGGCVVMMDCETGGIVALASRGDYDLNNYLALGEKALSELQLLEGTDEYDEAKKNALFRQWRNKAINDTYEPGSVFKTLTLSMALEEGVVDSSSSFSCGGRISVKGRTSPAKCWRRQGHGGQTLVQAVQHSCNVAFVNIGLRVGAPTFYEYAERFGLFSKTGIDLYGEASSQWWSSEVFCDPENLSQLAAASFGQTFNITPIQMARAYCAVANGGELPTPHVVSRITAPDGTIVYLADTETKTRVISEETSKTVCAILEQVVGGEEGTGKNARVAGYRIAGKTGTSEKVAQNAATGTKEYMVSFCAIAPADDPQLVLLVILDAPSSSTGIYISGGVMAAPVAGSILSEVLPYIGAERNEDAPKPEETLWIDYMDDEIF